MLFLTLGSADRRFAEGELIWRRYTVVEGMRRTRKVVIIGPKDQTYYN